MEAMQGKHGELQKWTTLDIKMNELGQAIDSNLPAIGEQMAVILAQDPGAYMPSVEIGQTFDGNLNMVRGKKTELLDQANAERHKLQKVNDMIAKVDKDLSNAARGLIGATIEGFLPDEVALAGEASVIVLGAYFGPPGIIAASIAWGATATFNALINTYYNTKAAADQARVLSEMKQGLLARKKQLEEGLENLTQGAREMDQIEQILDKHNQKLDEFKLRINEAKAQWNGQSQSAFENQKRKMEEEVRKIEAQPKQTIRLGGYAHGMEPIPPIEPGEYMGEVNAIVGQLRSYAQAVEDGGDPEAFLILADDWFKRSRESIQKRMSEYDQVRERYNQAQWRTWEILSAAWSRYRQAMDALWASYRGRNWDEAARAAAARIQAQYDATVQAAYAALKPFGQALINPHRELVKIQRIIWEVETVYYLLAQRVEASVRQRTTEFWQTYALWSNKLEPARQKVGQAVAGIPWYVASWEKRAQQIDEDVAHSLRWGENIVTIRSGLLATAESLRNMDRAIKEAIKNYQEPNNAAILLANQAQADLNRLLARYGRQINYNYYYYLSSHYESYFRPRAAEQAEVIKQLSERVKNDFTVNEPWNLAEAKKANLPATATLYENKAQELTFYTDWIDMYLHRQAGAAARLDRISREQTGAGLYASREGSPQETIQKEFLQPPFNKIVTEVETLVTAAELEKLPWIKVQPWAGMNPGQKLNTAQQAILQKMETDTLYYLRSRRSGWFQPVAENIIKPLEERWQKLSALCKLYDSAMAPLREGVRNAQAEISKEVAPVWETWNRMPAHSRNAVSGQHSRFRAALEWLNGYVSLKSNAVQYNFAAATNKTTAELDLLLADYRPALEKYRREQEEAQRRYEEEQRRLAELERIRAEEERKRQEELKKRAEAELNQVKNLYAAFKSAYESRNDSQVMSLISDGWESGDGTTLADLQSNLRRTFRTFDEIRYNFQNLRIVPTGAGRFSVSYDLAITSRIFRRNIRHEEKSGVNEEVSIDAAGKAKISRTLTGRFWPAP